MVSDPRTLGLHETCKQRGPNRPLHRQGGGSNYLENSLAAAAEPFNGITTGGVVMPGLFGIERTGVSTQTIREAAEAFLSSLNPDQRAKTLSPFDTDQWRKWSNIHPTLMRHGTALFEMTDAQRDCAFALLRERRNRSLPRPANTPACAPLEEMRIAASRCSASLPSHSAPRP